MAEEHTPQPEPADPPEGQLLIYEDGSTRLQIRLEGRTVWLSQRLIAELYQTSKQNISLHLRNIFAEEELDERAVVKEFLTTAADGKQYQTLHYSLDAILAVGYRVRLVRRRTPFDMRRFRDVFPCPYRCPERLVVPQRERERGKRAERPFVVLHIGPGPAHNEAELDRRVCARADGAAGVAFFDGDHGVIPPA